MRGMIEIDVKSGQISHLALPEGMTWLDYLDQREPGFKDAYLERMFWQGEDYEVVTFPEGTSIYPTETIALTMDAEAMAQTLPQPILERVRMVK